jgi:hypothetical protein
MDEKNVLSILLLGSRPYPKMHKGYGFSKKVQIAAPC